MEEGGAEYRTDIGNHNLRTKMQKKNHALRTLNIPEKMVGREKS